LINKLHRIIGKTRKLWKKHMIYWRPFWAHPLKCFINTILTKFSFLSRQLSTSSRCSDASCRVVTSRELHNVYVTFKIYKYNYTKITNSIITLPTSTNVHIHNIIFYKEIMKFLFWISNHKNQYYHCLILYVQHITAVNISSCNNGTNQ